MPAVTSSFPARDTTPIVFDLYGESSRRDRAVLIHSLAMDRAYWRPVAERLEKANVCVAVPDCRGHGESGKPPGPYTVGLFADDIGALLDQLGWPRAVFAGSSMGGSVALGFAVRHPDRVAGLTLIDTTAWYGKDAEAAWAQRAKAARDKGLPSLIDFQLSRWFSDAFKAQHPEVVEACVATFLRNDVKAYAEACRMLGEFDVRNGLRFLKMPVRILVGEEDYATPPAMAEEMNAIMEQSTYRLLPKARHLTPLERPDEVAEEILATIAAA
jgi:3-oxoadipate enol-lactonase